MSTYDDAFDLCLIASFDIEPGINPTSFLEYSERVHGTSQHPAVHWGIRYCQPIGRWCLRFPAGVPASCQWSIKLIQVEVNHEWGFQSPEKLSVRWACDTLVCEWWAVLRERDPLQVALRNGGGK